MLLLLTTARSLGAKPGSLITTLFLLKVLPVNASTVSTFTGILVTDSNNVLRNLPPKHDVISESLISVSGYDPVLLSYSRTQNATSGLFHESGVGGTNNALNDDGALERLELTAANTGSIVSIITTSTTKIIAPVVGSGQGVVGAAEYQQTLAITEKLRLALHLTALPLNSVNVVAYVQKSLRSPTATYQVAMSTSQILYISAVLVMPLAKLVYRGAESSYFGLVYSMAFGHYFIISVNRVMNGLVCLVSTERLLAIAFPLKAKLFSVSKRPLVPIAILVVAVFLSHSYLAVKYEFYELAEAVTNTSPSSTCSTTSHVSRPSVTTDNVDAVAKQGDATSAPGQPLSRNLIDPVPNNITMVYSTASKTVRSSDQTYSSQISTTAVISPCPTSINHSTTPSALATSWSLRPSSAYLWSPYLMDTWGVVASCVWMYGAFLLMLLLNTLLAFSLWRHTRQRRSLATGEGADKTERQVRQTTITVLASNIVFVFLSLLPVSNAMANYLHPNYNTRTKYRYTYLLVHEIGQLSFSLRMCTDLLTFVLLSSAYRATLCQLIGRACACLGRKNFQTNSDSGNKSTLHTSDTRTGTQSYSIYTQDDLKGCRNNNLKINI